MLPDALLHLIMGSVVVESRVEEGASRGLDMLLLFLTLMEG